MLLCASVTARSPTGLPVAPAAARAQRQAHASSSSATIPFAPLAAAARVGGTRLRSNAGKHIRHRSRLSLAPLVRASGNGDDESPDRPSNAGPPEPEGDLGILPNTGRYALYFVSVLTGTAYVAFRPVLRFMKGSPLKVLLVLGSAAGTYCLVSFVVQAMLGLNDDPFGGPVRGANGGF